MDAVLVVLGLVFFGQSVVEAFDPLDPGGNITIKWDLMSWTSDGYVALVSIINYQHYRHIEVPGWTLGWIWDRSEVIWDMIGAQATMQGDCSKFHGVAPHCCKRNPTIVDLLPDVPYSMRVANCCKSGVLTSPLQDPENSVAVFQLSVGQAGNATTVYPPVNFTLGEPGPGYVCGPAVKVRPSLFPTSDGRRFTQALMTWNVTCKYSQFLAQKAPTCCVSYSSFYNETIIPCQSCACRCSYNLTQPSQNPQPMCLETNRGFMKSPGYSTGVPWEPPELYCTWDMCPVKIHWHVKTNYYDYWRAKITITNRSLQKNRTQWNVVVEHPNFDNLTTAFSFNYKGLSNGHRNNNTGMLWGMKYYNEMLVTAGPNGNVQSELLFRKDPNRFTLANGWAFPRKVYFNGDECVLPPSHVFPFLPSAAVLSRFQASTAMNFRYVIAALSCLALIL